MRQFLFVFVLLFSVCSATAQFQFDTNHHVGCWAGATGSRLGVNPSVPQTFSVGKAFGVGYSYYSDHLAQGNWGIGMEINYIEKGWVEEVAAPEYYEKRLSYLEIPLFTRISFENNNWALMFHLGPFMSFKLKETEDNGTVTAPRFYAGIDTQQSFEFGLGGGLSLIKKLGRSRLGLEVRYMHSLSSVFEYDPNSLLSAAHQYASVGLSYYFAIQRNSFHE